MYVIEYQHRGLPHAHIVAKLSDAPTTIQEKLQWIDKNIQARFPDNINQINAVIERNKNGGNNWEGLETDVKYVQQIKSVMIHRCSASVNGCKNKDGICKEGYMTLQVNDTSSFDTKGYPVYFKPTEQDIRVVPHNRELLLDWNGHINVEYCGKTYTVLYLYKYLYKGNKKTQFTISNLDGVDPQDEITIYIRGRLLCSMDACWTENLWVPNIPSFLSLSY
jgi:hypothetical protein